MVVIFHRTIVENMNFILKIYNNNKSKTVFGGNRHFDKDEKASLSWKL